MKYTESQFTTLVVILPTENKCKTYEEIRNLIRMAVGSLYEDEDARDQYGVDGNPSNVLILLRQLTAPEKTAVKDICELANCVPFIIEGPTDKWDKLDSNTITL